MYVTVEVEFEVPDADAQDVARQAAELAVLDYLTFCEVSGENTDTDEVTVHVDGHGAFRVRLVDR